MCLLMLFFFFQAEDGIRDRDVTGVQTCALPICLPSAVSPAFQLKSPLSVESNNRGKRFVSCTHESACACTTAEKPRTALADRPGSPEADRGFDGDPRRRDSHRDRRGDGPADWTSGGARDAADRRRAR